MRIMLGIISLAVVWFCMPSASSNYSFDTGSYHLITVHRGDTIWKIAAQFSRPKDDIRHLIVAIRAGNNLDDNAHIYPGQTLKIPILK